MNTDTACKDSSKPSSPLLRLIPVLVETLTQSAPTDINPDSSHGSATTSPESKSTTSEVVLVLKGHLSTVGEDVGSIEGAPEGSAEGSGLGKEEGSDEGTVLGCVEGLAEGAPEGCDEGWVDGMAV